MSNIEDQIALAKALAYKAHAGQVRRNGKPAITHPEAVAAAVQGLAKAVAWLHDVLEDSPLTVEDLQNAGISPEVIEAVLALTKREGEDFFKFVERTAQNPLAVQVKKADIEDNLRNTPSERARVKYKQALQFLNQPGSEIRPQM